jgi:hypothetical protein
MPFGGSEPVPSSANGPTRATEDEQHDADNKQNDSQYPQNLDIEEETEQQQNHTKDDHPAS